MELGSPSCFLGLTTTKRSKIHLDITFTTEEHKDTIPPCGIGK